MTPVPDLMAGHGTGPGDQGRPGALGGPADVPQLRRPRQPDPVQPSHPACGPLTADLAEALDLAWRRSGWPWGRPGRLGPGPGIGRRQARGFVSLGLAAPAERASRLRVAREVSVTTVLPPPLAHRCVSTRQHDQESEVTRTRCLRGPSAAGRPMEAGQSACNVAVRLCPARRYAAASRRAWSAPVAAYEPLPGVRQRRSECLRIRPGTAVPLSPADLSAHVPHFSPRFSGGLGAWLSIVLRGGQDQVTG